MSKVAKTLPKWVKVICAAAPEMDVVRVFEDFVEMMFHALQGRRDEAMRVSALNGDEARLTAFLQAAAMLGEEMEKRRFEDVLGEVHQEIRSMRSQQSTGSFYTPTGLCEAMAQLVVQPDHEEVRRHLEQGKVYRVADPAVGAGRTLLSFAKEHIEHLELMRFYGTDIELNACRMAYVNMALNGMAAEIRHGDGLKNRTFAVWRTPWWNVYEEKRRAARFWRGVFGRLTELTAGEFAEKEPRQREFDFMVKEDNDERRQGKDD